MAEQTKGIALAILGIVAVIAIIGLVLMFAKMKGTGAGVYGAGTNVGYAANIYSNERILYSGIVEQPNMPQNTEEIYKVQGSWKTGYRQPGHYTPDELTLTGNVPITSCFAFSQFARVKAQIDPAYAKYVDYAATASVQQALSQYNGNCVNVKVNGHTPFAGLCCYQPANWR